MKLLKKLLAVALAIVMTGAMAVTVFASPNELPPNVTITEVDEIVYAIALVNVRKGPGLEYDIITTLNYGEAVRRIGICSNSWSKVVYKNQEAYMYTPLISTKKPSNFGGTAVDDTALKQQLGIANGLVESDYTKASWEVLAAAVKSANEALESGSQDLIDEAAQSLKDAIASLVKMDYTALERILLDVDTFTNQDDLNSTWSELLIAAEAGRALLDSGDQEAVDAAAAQITELLTQLEGMVADRLAPNVVVQEVPVEVPPTDDYCNIPLHRTWPVLFIISFAVNVALIAVIGLYIFKKRKTQRDDTPLVDYDIDDDTF